MKMFLIAAILAGTTLAGVAVAQTPPSQMPPAGGGRGMMRADTDGDGRVSRAEAIAEADVRFARQDVNGDGKLCGDEMMRGRRAAATTAGSDTTMPPPMPATQRGMAKQDKDGDGCISRDEFRARALKRFDRLDANHDGFIDAAEMQAMQDRMSNMRGRQQSPEGEPSMPAPPPPPTGRDAQQNPGQ